MTDAEEAALAWFRLHGYVEHKVGRVLFRIGVVNGAHIKIRITAGTFGPGMFGGALPTDDDKERLLGSLKCTSWGAALVRLQELYG